jgi:hypothetical protein
MTQMHQRADDSTTHTNYPYSTGLGPSWVRFCGRMRDLRAGCSEWLYDHALPALMYLMVCVVLSGIAWFAEQIAIERTREAVDAATQRCNAELARQREQFARQETALETRRLHGEIAFTVMCLGVSVAAYQWVEKHLCAKYARREQELRDAYKQRLLEERAAHWLEVVRSLSTHKVPDAR